jgi:phosphate transport system substrate-binding protein
MAYVPYSFVQEAGSQVKALEIDGGDGCVAPATEAVQDGSYSPLGRPLFIYPSAEALARPEFVAFMEFYIENQATLTEAAIFVPMTDEQAADSQAKIDELAGAGA